MWVYVIVLLYLLGIVLVFVVDVGWINVVVD